MTFGIILKMLNGYEKKLIAVADGLYRSPEVLLRLNYYDLCFYYIDRIERTSNNITLYYNDGLVFKAPLERVNRKLISILEREVKQ